MKLHNIAESGTNRRDFMKRTGGAIAATSQLGPSKLVSALGGADHGPATDAVATAGTHPDTFLCSYINHEDDWYKDGNVFRSDDGRTVSLRAVDDYLCGLVKQNPRNLVNHVLGGEDPGLMLEPGLVDTFRKCADIALEKLGAKDFGKVVSSAALDGDSFFGSWDLLLRGSPRVSRAIGLSPSDFLKIAKNPKLHKQFIRHGLVDREQLQEIENEYSGRFHEFGGEEPPDSQRHEPDATGDVQHDQDVARWEDEGGLYEWRNRLASIVMRARP